MEKVFNVYVLFAFPIVFLRNESVFLVSECLLFFGFTQTCLAFEASSFARMLLLCCFITSAFTTLMPQAMRSVSAIHLFTHKCKCCSANSFLC